MPRETPQNNYTRVFLQTTVGGSGCRNVLCHKVVGVDMQ